MINAPIPSEWVDALGLRAGGAQLHGLQLARYIQPVVLWPLQERTAEVRAVTDQRAYMGFAYIAAVAAQFQHVQLWNASTNKRLIVWDWTISNLNVANLGVEVAHSETALTTVYQSPQAKRLAEGAASTAAQIRTQSNAAALGTTVLHIMSLPAYQLERYAFKQPVVLEPGCGVIIRGAAVNVNLGVNFEHEEEDL